LFDFGLLARRETTLCTMTSLAFRGALPLFLLAALAHCSSNDSATNEGAAGAGAAGAQSVAGASGSAGSTMSMGGSPPAVSAAGGAGSSTRGGSAGAAQGGAGNGGVSGAGGGGGAGGSAGDGGNAGGSGNSALYAPFPPKGTPCVIMPIGDSITWGYDSTTGGGYRLRLLHDIWTANHDATFVGDSTSGPDTLDGKPFPKHSEGFSGYTIDDAPSVMRSGVSPLVPAALAKYTPNIVTLMIGTNDMGTNNDVANAPSRLAKLIDAILGDSPQALLVVAQITPTGDDQLNKLIQTYNAAMPALIKTRADAGKHILLVDMYGAFTADANFKVDYMNGSLHPNDTGYDVMGDIWYTALAPHL
jgi:lysophospholipase L1-like esterase